MEFSLISEDHSNTSETASQYLGANVACSLSLSCFSSSLKNDLVIEFRQKKTEIIKSYS